MTIMTAIQHDASSEWATPTGRRFSTTVDRIAEAWEGFTYRLPVVIMRRSRMDEIRRTVFDLGRECEKYAAEPMPAARQVRHLRVVGS